MSCVGGDAIAVADVNGDGKLDLALANAYSNNAGVLVGNGDGTFQKVFAYDSGNGDGLSNGGRPVSIALGDTNGDGKPDLVVGSQFARLVGVLINNNGAPPTTTALATSVNPVRLKQVVTYTAAVVQSGITLSGTVTFTAKVTSPTMIPKRPVTFTAGTQVLGTAQLSAGKTTFTTSLLPAGSTVVKVTFAGDSNIVKSSASVTQVVQP